jgi:DNA polymerase III subunit epsilon
VRASADAGGCFPTGRHYPGIAQWVRAASRGTLRGYAAETLVTDLPLISIDVEATGLDPQQDRLVEVACVVFAGGQVERHAWLINPGRPIPAESQAVHQISDEMVKDASPFTALVEVIAAQLARGVPLAYNAEFDRAFLAAEFARARPGAAALDVFAPGVQWLDPLVWARHLQPDEKSRALTAVAERLGIEIGQAHRAADDAEAAGHVFRAFLDRGDLPKTYGAFVQEQRRLHRLQADERAVWRG